MRRATLRLRGKQQRRFSVDRCKWKGRLSATQNPLHSDPSFDVRNDACTIDVKYIHGSCAGSIHTLYMTYLLYKEPHADDHT